MRRENVLLIRLLNNRRYKYCISERAQQCSGERAHTPLLARIFRLVFGAPPFLLRCFFIIVLFRFYFFFLFFYERCGVSARRKSKTIDATAAPDRWESGVHTGVGPTGWLFLCNVRRIEPRVVLRYFTYTHIADVAIKYGTFYIHLIQFKQH